MKSIKDIDITVILLIALVVRVVTLGASIGDSIALLGLAALFGFKSFISKKETDWKAEIDRQLEVVKNELTSMRLNNSIVRKSNETKQKPEEGKRWF